MWNGEKVSVVFPTYNEQESIRSAIEDFFRSGVVDEIVVINNNAAPGTSEEVAQTRAVEVFEPRQGYGYAIQRGLREATGDLLIIAEPDGTFLGRDVLKLLAYAEDFDCVFGSRTSQTLIWRGANMGWFLRWGNWAVAKLTEMLFNTTTLTDVGCTMRLIHADALEVIKPSFSVGGNHFGPEMLLHSVRTGLRVIQIPVNYLPRVGTSSVTGDLGKAVVLGVHMIGMILAFRFGLWRRQATGETPDELDAEREPDVMLKD